MRVLLLALLGLAAVSGVAAQGEGQPCTSTCSTGFACLMGICAPTAGMPPAGSARGPCIGGLQGTCNAGNMCLFGICAPTGGSIGGGEAGTLGGSCKEGAVCNDGLFCVPEINICGQMTQGSGDDGSGDSGAEDHGSEGSPCADNFDCDSSYCRFGQCAAFQPPALDCGGSCGDGKVCRFGMCITRPPTVQCAAGQCFPGEQCNTTVGLCVENEDVAPTCSPACPTGTTCDRPPFPGMPPVCRSSTPCSSSATCGDGVCSLAYCRPCRDSFCTNAPAGALSLLGLTGVVTAFNAFVDAVAAAGAINAGRLQPAAGELVRLTSALASQLQDLTFPASVSSSQGAQVDGQLTIPAINAANRFGQLAVSAAAQLTGTTLTVPAAGGLTVALAAGSSDAQPTRVKFGTLNLSGPLNIVAGGDNTVLELPAEASGVTVAAGANIRVKGPVQIKGSANTAPMTLDNSGMDRAMIAAQQMFRTAGNILGSDASLEVNGDFQFRGKILESTLLIKGGGSADIAEPAEGELQAGPLSFGGSSESATRTLKLTNSDSSATGSRVYFGEVEDCPSSATIVLNIPGQNTREAALRNGVTFMNYKPFATATASIQFTCSLRVCDEAGCTDIANPNVVAAGRRLLADGTAKASWGPSALSAQTGAAAMAAASMAIMAIMAIMANGMQRLF